MDDFAAAEQLRELLHVTSAETRYGAFRSLWAMNPNEPAIRGEQLGNQFSYHIVQTSAPPMVHVTRSRRPEVVLFGRDQRFTAPFTVEAGNRIVVSAKTTNEVIVSRFAPNEADQKRVVANSLDAVIRAMVELGGTYPDVVQALQQAKVAGAMAGRFEVDALPESGRLFDRVADEDDAKEQGRRQETSKPARMQRRPSPPPTARCPTCLLTLPITTPTSARPKPQPPPTTSPRPNRRSPSSPK